MANNLPPVRRFMAEDFPEAPRWFSQQFLPALNSYTDAIYQVLDGRVEIGQNTREEIYERKFTANGLTNNFTFTPQSFVGQPRGVQIAQCDGVSFTHIPAAEPIALDWVNTGTGQINVTKIHNLTEGMKYNLRLRIF